MNFLLQILTGAVTGFAIMVCISIPMVAFVGWLDDWYMVNTFTVYCEGVLAMSIFGAFIGTICGLIMSCN